MKIDLSFLKNIDEDDKLFLKQVSDWVYAAENKYVNNFSFFLNEKQIALCERFFASQKFQHFCFWGGYENAKRKILCVHSEFGEINNDSFPLTPLIFRYRKVDNLTHRDFLGSFMALNVARQTIGDIITGEGETQVFVYKKVSPIIIDEILKIGRTGVSVSEGVIDNIGDNQDFKEICGTVSSLRIDCILSLVLRLSREKIKTLISTKGVNVNYMSVNKADYQLKQNDVFSVRGYGKFVFESVDGITKKDRYHITVKKYI